MQLLARVGAQLPIIRDRPLQNAARCKCNRYNPKKAANIMIVFVGDKRKVRSFDRCSQHKDASADAWRQMLAFIKEHVRQSARA